LNISNCTIDSLTTSSTMGGVISMFPSTSGTLEILFSLFSYIHLVNTSTTSGGVLYVSTTPQYMHLYNTTFSFSKVCCFILFFSCLYMCMYIYPF
jgi:hypothetical protein